MPDKFIFYDNHLTITKAHESIQEIVQDMKVENTNLSDDKVVIEKETKLMVYEDVFADVQDDIKFFAQNKNGDLCKRTPQMLSYS